MFTIQQRRLEAAQRMARYRVDVFRERFIVVDLQNDVKDPRQLNELYGHTPIVPYHSVCCYTSGFRFAPLESLCLRHHRRYEYL